MDFDIFLREVISRLQKRLGEECRIEKNEINNINGIHRHFIEIIEKSCGNIHPCISMDVFYEQFIFERWDINRAVDEICITYEKSILCKDIDISFFDRWETVKSRIYSRLINTEMNEDFLKEIPHREFLDLSFVYYVVVEEVGEEESLAIQIKNDHIQYWHIDEGTLYDVAWENILETDETVFKEMGDILGINIPIPGFKHIQGPPMYVLSNKKGLNGAIQIGNPEVLQRIGSFLKGDFWVLPSSIHECIVVPFESLEDGAERLAHIVRDVNRECVNHNEILSYHVYRYCRFSGEVVIAA